MSSAISWNKVLVVRLDHGTSDWEFCVDERDRGCAKKSGNPQDRSCSCRLLQNSCDFIVADPRTGEISEPEPITTEAIAANAGESGLPLLQPTKKNPELLPEFKFGQNECNLKSAAIQPGPSPPHTVPTCTHCEVPASAGQP